MFNNIVKPNPNFIEGTVLQVDASTSLCSVRTIRGGLYPSVTWLSESGGSGRAGSRACPEVGARVVVSLVLGYPVILGCLPRIQASDGASPLSLFDGTAAPVPTSLGNSDVVFGDQNKPSDLVQGDRVISSPGAATIATLRGGTVLLRGSRVAEIVLSKILSLVRVVSRNWEHFTDVSSDVVKNYAGRVYRYTGYAKTFAETKIEDYKLHFYYGDAAAAETVKTNYNSYTGTPPTTSALFKEQVTSVSVPEVMHRVINDAGEVETKVTNATHFVRTNQTGEEFRITWNDQNEIVITETSIHVYHKDGADLIMDASGIRGTMGGSLVNVTSGAISCTNGSGESYTSSSVTRIVNGSHAVTVTSGGVAIT